MYTFNKIYDALKSIATAHRQIHTFGIGDLWEIAASGTINYPMLFVIPEAATVKNGEVGQELTLLVMDRVMKSEQNEEEVISDMQQVMLDVIAQLQSPDYDFDVDLRKDQFTMNPFTERFADEVTGWECKVKLWIPWDASRCAIPQTTVNTGTPTCPDVQILDSNGAIVENVPAGGVYTVSNVTVKNSDSTYTSSPACGTTLTLPDVTHRTPDNIAIVKPAITIYDASMASYENIGGIGNRTSIITVTTTLTGGTGSPSLLVDGDITATTFWRAIQPVLNKIIKFDFLLGNSKVIKEAFVMQNSAASHGTWQWQGSNNDIDWINIGSTFAFGTANNPHIRMTSLGANTTGYRYYRMIGISGDFSSGPVLREFEFKIINA